MCNELLLKILICLLSVWFALCYVFRVNARHLLKISNAIEVHTKFVLQSAFINLFSI